METVFEVAGGLFKALGWLLGLFLVATLACSILYVAVYTVGFMFLAGR